MTKKDYDKFLARHEEVLADNPNITLAHLREQMCQEWEIKDMHSYRALLSRLATLPEYSERARALMRKAKDKTVVAQAAPKKPKKPTHTVQSLVLDEKEETVGEMFCPGCKTKQNPVPGQLFCDECGCEVSQMTPAPESPQE